jgi:biopolymer transport protein ExbD
MMLTKWKKQHPFEAESFDMTPIIDVVFLLIIFFMLVCQFIAAEQFQVQVPDQIRSAETSEPQKNGPLTITVMAGLNGEAVYAVGSEKLEEVGGRDLAQLIRSEIDRSMSGKGDTDKTVRLRCDKSITFGQVKYILSGISKSTAATLDWAVLSE